MAEFIAKDIINKNVFKNNFIFSSAGLHNYHEGDSMHMGTYKKLKEMNIECENFVSKPINKKMFDEFDLIYVMDNSNYEEIVRKFGNNVKVKKICNYSTLGYLEVPDPWYTNDFDETYKILFNAIQNLICDLK